MSAAKQLSIRLAAVGGDKVRQEFKSLGNDGQRAFARITQVISPANDNLRKLNDTAKVFGSTLKQVYALAGAFLGFKGITGTFSAIFNANKTFEQLSGSLKTVTGSAQNAKAAFALIEDFATATPYQIEEIVQAFIRLKALGLDPSKDALNSYGNTASAFGKNILDFTDAVAAATVGSDNSFAVVATDSDKIVGLLIANKKNAPYLENPIICNIGTLGVNEKYRGKGIGKKLMKEFLEFCKENGIKEVKLGVFNDNKVAYKFYEGYGFKPQEQEMSLKFN